MSEASDEISELMALQREAAELRSRPRKKKVDAPAEGADPAPDSAPEPGPGSELESSMQELSANLESAMKEIEDTAREQPVLTALVAFTLGIVVGQLFSRR